MEPTAPVRVLLVDDDPLVRTGLRMMLTGDGDLEVVGEVGDGAQVPQAVDSCAPDVLLMDIRMPVCDGIEATRRLRGRRAAPAVLVLTTFDSDANVVEAVRAGAAGFLVKHTPPERLVEAVRRAAAGEPVLSPGARRSLLDRVAGDGGPVGRVAAARARWACLSDREREVAAAVARGLSNTAIAGRLYMSVGTVKAHISSALTKLELANRIQLAVLAHDAVAED